MRADKVLRRLARVDKRPDVLDRVARDVGQGLAQGQRDDLLAVARELAAQAPDGDPDKAGYWAGFTAAMGTLLAAYEAAHEQEDAQAAAMRAIASSSAETVILELAQTPATGAELATRLSLTPSATSKILKSLRAAGLARILGGPPTEPIPERGAPKPHVLTSLGANIARQLGSDAHIEPASIEAAMR